MTCLKTVSGSLVPKFVYYTPGAHRGRQHYSEGILSLLPRFVKRKRSHVSSLFEGKSAPPPSLLHTHRHAQTRSRVTFLTTRSTSRENAFSHPTLVCDMLTNRFNVLYTFTFRYLEQFHIRSFSSCEVFSWPLQRVWVHKMPRHRKTVSTRVRRLLRAQQFSSRAALGFFVRVYLGVKVRLYPGSVGSPPLGGKACGVATWCRPVVARGLSAPDPSEALRQPERVLRGMLRFPNASRGR